MKKTVGMITIYRKNYGAFLQAYALQQTLKAIGYAPEIIRYDYYKDHSIFCIPLVYIKNPIRFFKMLAVELIKYSEHNRRGKVFAKSISKNISESKEYYKKYRDLVKKPPHYDLYLTGSDQVFNVKLSPHALKARLLCFVENGKKASYAASAGKNEIPEFYDKTFVDALGTFSKISVRESGLKEYIKGNYGLQAEQHVDPTFLLTKNEWIHFAHSDDSLTGKYIFYYRVLKQDLICEKARDASKELGLPIFVADGNDRFDNQMKREGILSPEEWIGMMKNAAYVVTNSFHGAAFAINLGKRATIITPPVGGERVCELLQKCNLQDAVKMSLMPEDVSAIYADAQVYFAREREKAIEYLKSLL